MIIHSGRGGAAGADCIAIGVSNVGSAGSSSSIGSSSKNNLNRLLGSSPEENDVL